jgi:hypothetical protein
MTVTVTVTVTVTYLSDGIMGGGLADRRVRPGLQPLHQLVTLRIRPGASSVTPVDSPEAGLSSRGEVLFVHTANVMSHQPCRGKG